MQNISGDSKKDSDKKSIKPADGPPPPKNNPYIHTDNEIYISDGVSLFSSRQEL